jgi:hypothetical protein
MVSGQATHCHALEELLAFMARVLRQRRPQGEGALRAKVGTAITVKFSLGGDQGLSIFAAGSPALSRSRVTPQCRPVVSRRWSRRGQQPHV